MLVLALEQIQFRQLRLALAQRLLLARQRLHRLIGRFVGKAGYMLHGPGTSGHWRTPGVTASTLSSPSTTTIRSQIGRASCRESVCKSGWNSGAADTLKK